MFLTGSDTFANALVGNPQVMTAKTLNLNPVLTASVSSAAGVMGGMISLQSIAGGVRGHGVDRKRPGQTLPFTIKHSAFLACVVGAVATLDRWLSTCGVTESVSSSP